MTGRAAFIHIGAMLATIMLVNVHSRIWPVERRRLAPSEPAERPSVLSLELASQRLRHNAALAIAVLFFMLSNHFPLIYGHTQAWMIPPIIVGSVWLSSHLVSLRGPYRAAQHA
jgi:uncharacterized membrane protein